MNDFVVQAVGFAGMAFFIISYQIRSNRALFLLQLMGCVVFLIQFMMMGAYTGAVSLLINIIRNLLLLRSQTWKWVRSRMTMGAILACLTAMTVCTWSGPVSLLPYIAAAITTIGYWTENARSIRTAQLVGTPCTLLYDLVIGSWGGAVSETVTLLSVIISVLRFGEETKNNFGKSVGTDI